MTRTSTMLKDRLIRAVISVGVVLWAGLSSGHGLAGDVPKLVQRTESFDRDPRWDGQNNRVKPDKPIPVVQDFGYSRTNHAGGKSAGEIGGRIQRSTTAAFYGKRLEASKTLNDKLRCSGSLAVTKTDGLSTVYFGWFNTRTSSSRPYNWMGFFLDGSSRGCVVHTGYRTSGGISDGIGRITGYGPGWYQTPRTRDFNQIPVKTRYTFDFAYDPDGGDGHGQFTFTLGGEGPYTGGPFTFKLPANHRESGATFDAFGIINAQSAGYDLTMYVDDLVIDGAAESFDTDPQWLGQGNRQKHDDYGLNGSHQFGYSDTAIAGGKKGELAGLLYSSPAIPGYYADRVGPLTLNQKLTASGKVALTEYGSDSGVYFGWFDSQKRGHPAANVLGVMIDGPTSTPPRFRGVVGSSDPKTGLLRRDTAAFIPPDGKSHTWKIEYDPGADEGRGRLTVWLGDRQDTFVLPTEVRKAGAAFDRFGLFVHEGGGTASRIALDDLQYTAANDKRD